MLLEKIHKLIDIAVDKGHTALQRREDIDNAIFRSSLMLFSEKVKRYGKDLLINQQLQPFEVVDNGYAVSDALPASYYRYTYLAKTDDTPIDVVSDGEWSKRVKNSVAGPNQDYPIAKIETRKVIVNPTSIQTVKIKYLKTPIYPEYKTTIVNGEQVFDKDNSVDIEWNEAELPDLLANTLSFLGISLRAEDVIQYAELQDKKQ